MTHLLCINHFILSNYNQHPVLDNPCSKDLWKLYTSHITATFVRWEWVKTCNITTTKQSMAKPCKYFIWYPRKCLGVVALELLPSCTKSSIPILNEFNNYSVSRSNDWCIYTLSSCIIVFIWYSLKSQYISLECLYNVHTKCIFLQNENIFNQIFFIIDMIHTIMLLLYNNIAWYCIKHNNAKVTKWLCKLKQYMLHISPPMVEL